MRRYDLTVRRAQSEWKQMRWALFVFRDIRDVEPTDDPEVIRISYEGKRAYADVWRTELLQAGFDVPPVGSQIASSDRRVRAGPDRAGDPTPLAVSGSAWAPKTRPRSL